MQTAQSGYGHRFAFLTPQILLIPNPLNNALDIFRIPPVGTTPCKLAKLKIVSFSLPENLKRSCHYVVECFSQPNSREFGVSGEYIQSTYITYIPEPGTLQRDPVDSAHVPTLR